MTTEEFKQRILEFRTSYTKDLDELKELLKLASQFNDKDINGELGYLFDKFLWDPMEEGEE